MIEGIISTSNFRNNGISGILSSTVIPFSYKICHLCLIQYSVAKHDYLLNDWLKRSTFTHKSSLSYSIFILIKVPIVVFDHVCSSVTDLELGTIILRKSPLSTYSYKLLIVVNLLIILVPSRGHTHI